MRSDSWILGISGVVFGLLVGWIIALQVARPDTTANAAGPDTTASSDAQPGNAGGSGGAGNGGGQGSPSATPLDENRVREMVSQANQNPKDAAVRAQLGNLYFDAERYTESVKWYEASLALDPKNPDVSTDLGVSYYYTNQTDRALQQFARSL